MFLACVISVLIPPIFSLTFAAATSISVLVIGIIDDGVIVPLFFQVPNNDILTQNLYYNYYYPNPKYLIIGFIGYMDPLGSSTWGPLAGWLLVGNWGMGFRGLGV